MRIETKSSGFIRSFDSVPLTGTIPVDGAIATHIATAVGTLMLAAIQIGAPVLGALFLTEVALALAARFVPQANVFLVRSSLQLFNNFTYFLDDPVAGDQFEQSEERSTAGGRVTFRRLHRWAGRHAESAAGVQVRRDWLDPVGLYHTSARRRIATVREDEVDQTMTGVYGQTEIEWSRTARTTFGLRADLYQFSVTADVPENSGRGSKALASPKVSAVFGPFAATEFYANAGLGFHSNDARGATIAIDPKSGEPVDRVTPLVRARGAEFGVRTVRVRGLQSTLALWYLGLDSELLFVGDAGTTEAGRPSRRVGLEWANYWRPASWLRIPAPTRRWPREIGRAHV